MQPPPTPTADLAWPIVPLPPDRAPVQGGGFAGDAIPASPDPLVRYRWSATPPEAELQLYSLLPGALSATGTPPEGLAGLATPTGEATIAGPCVIAIDFGVVSAGWVQFSSPDLGDAAGLEIGLAAHAGGPLKRLQPVRHGEVFRLEPNRELYEGVRFAWIRITGGARRWRLRDLRLVCQAKPANYTGSFSCSDPLLERIWYTGAYTVRVCYQRDYMGTILDDRGDRNTFTGDAHVAQAVSLAAFGNYGFVRRNIAFTPGPDDHNGILSYPLYWILSIAEYVLHSGDLASFEDWRPSAETILARADGLYDSEFHQTWAGWDQRLGGGFEFPDSQPNRACYRMLAIRAWLAFAGLLEQSGRTAAAGRFRGLAGRRIAQLRADPDWIGRVGLYAALLAVEAGFTTADEEAAITAQHGRDPVVLSFISPFHQYFVLAALSRLRRHGEALRLLRDIWGGMLAHGATTFYELYRPELNAVMPQRSLLDCSLTHPWSAGATAWLSGTLAGIRPVSPGYATWLVAPLATPELTRIAARVRTPHGDLAVRLDTARGSLELEAPPGTSGRLTVPGAGRRIVGLAIGGRSLWPRRAAGADGPLASSAEDGGVHLDGIPPGPLRLAITYAGPATAALAPPERQYPARVLACDATTGGAWPGVYGGLGHQLLTGEAAAPLRGELPGFIDRVWIRDGNAPVHATVARQSGDRRILADGVGGGQRLSDAHAVQTNPSAHSVWLHLELRQDRPHDIALYLLDWDGSLGSFAVEMYDGGSLDLIAPTQVAVAAHQGCYLRFAWHRSSVFRIYRGALSGIFIDHHGRAG